MATQPDNAFDLAIVDPPYGIGNWVQTAGKISTVNKLAPVDWNDAIPAAGYFKEMKRVSKNYIVWGWNYYTKYLGPTNSLIYWDKKMGSAKYSAGELACHSFTGNLTSVCIPLIQPAIDQKIRIHPCQKPVKLYDWLLTNYAEPGQRILDTHLGSASSAIAAHYYGVDFVGCEIDKDYYKAACARFDNETAQIAMF